MKLQMYIGVVALALNVCANGQGTSPSVPVTVVNAPSRPIPTVAQGTTAIAGTVSISGTPVVTANITNPIALAPGANVSVANAVNGTGIVPLVVRVTSSADAYPILLQFCRVSPSVATLCGLTAASNGTSTTIPATTPDGLTVKFADIDNFNSECNFAQGNATAQEVEVDFYLQGNLAEYAFPVPQVNNAHAMTNERTHIYADAGSAISIGQNFGIGLATGCAVTLSGHLVPQ